MKIPNSLKFFIAVLLLIINFTTGEITFKDFYEIVDQLGDAGNFDTNPKMIAFFKIIPRKKKSERRKLDYLAHVLQSFEVELSQLEHDEWHGSQILGDKLVFMY